MYLRIACFLSVWLESQFRIGRLSKTWNGVELFMHKWMRMCQRTHSHCLVVATCTYECSRQIHGLLTGQKIIFYFFQSPGDSILGRHFQELYMPESTPRRFPTPHSDSIGLLCRASRLRRRKQTITSRRRDCVKAVETKILSWGY